MQLSLSNITDIHLCFFDEALPECSRGPFFDSRCSFAAYSNTRLVESKVRPIIFVYIYICMLIFVYMYLYASVMCTCVCMCVCVCVLLLPCIYWWNKMNINVRKWCAARSIKVKKRDRQTDGRTTPDRYITLTAGRVIHLLTSQWCNNFYQLLLKIQKYNEYYKMHLVSTSPRGWCRTSRRQSYCCTSDSSTRCCRVSQVPAISTAAMPFSTQHTFHVLTKLHMEITPN